MRLNKSEQKFFLILLSSAFLKNIDIEPSKKKVLDNIEKKQWIQLSENDLKVLSTRTELTWRNDFAYSRNKLKDSGDIQNFKKDNWEISDQGYNTLSDYYSIISKNSNSYEILTDQAIHAASFLVKNQSIDFVNKTNYNFDKFKRGSKPLLDEAMEGHSTTSITTKKKRDTDLTKSAKISFKEVNDRLYCEVCGFDFEKIYGPRGKDFIEAHHKVHVSKMTDNHVSNIKDFIMLCPNCHEILHRVNDGMTTEDLKQVVNKYKNLNK